MKKITALLMIVMALVALTACGDYTSTKDNHSTVDSHDVTTTTTNTPAEQNTTRVVEGNITDSNNTLEVPTFTGNSQGKLVVQCEEDIVYYIMAYDCLKPDTKPTVTATGGTLTVDEELVHIGEVFYTKGHIERTGEVTVTGRVYSGGVTLPTIWVKTCE